MRICKITIFCLLFVQGVWGIDYVVNSSTDNSPNNGGSGSGVSGDLRYVLNQILNNQAQDSSPSTHTITFSVPGVTLNNIMPPINLFSTDTITIGNSSGTTTITGDGFRPFFVTQGNVTFQNLAIEGGTSQGGSGGDEGGGGGMGAGGAIFIDAATVTLSNVTFSSNRASAGLGGGYAGNGGGGGGGLGGNGGVTAGSGGFGGGGGYSGLGGSANGSFGGGGGVADGGQGDGSGAGPGGGGGILGANGGNADAEAGASVIGYVFGGGGAASSSGSGGGAGEGISPGNPAAWTGGGGGFNGSDISGGVGGGGGGDGLNGTGGRGGIGGGGGGSNGTGGDGGYGGGGGGGNSLGGTGNFGGGGGGGGGDGGFGGGGGSVSSSGISLTSGNGGFGGGGGIGANGGVGGTNISNSSGGDGAGMGGAIFVNTGTVIFQGNCSTSLNSVTANGGSGVAVGTDLFAVSDATITFSPGTGNTVTLLGTIADDSNNSIPSGQSWTAGTGSGLSLAMQGPGTLVLSGANTYAQGVTVGSGVLNVQNSSALGSGSASVASGAQLQVQSGITATNSLTLNGTGGGTGALLNVSGTNTYSGAITLGSDAAIGSTSGILTLSNTNAISGTHNLTFAGAGNTTVSGAIATSTGTLTKSGSGTLTLSQTNTYSGATSLSAGQITLNASAGLGTSTLTMSTSTTLSLGSSISASNNIILSASETINVASGTATLSGAINGGGSFTKTGLGTLSLTNINTYSTGAIISAGALNIQNNQALGDGSVSVASGAQLQLQGGITTNLFSANTLLLTGTGISSTGALLNVSGNNTYSQAITLQADATIGSTSGILTLSNSKAINGAHNLTFVGAGNTTVSGIIGIGAHTVTQSGSGILTLSGTNTYSGGTIVSSGFLNVQNSSGLGTGTASVTNGAQLQVQGGISPSNSLTLNGTGGGTGALLNVSGTNTYSGRITLGAATTIGSTSDTLTLSNTNAISGTHNLTFAGSGNTTVSGNIATSTGTITKNGSGTLTLSGTNTYSGGTVVSGGRLSVNGQILGGITVNSGGTLGGIGIIYGGGTIQGMLSPGNSIGTLTFDTSGGDLILDSSSLTNIEIDPIDNSKIAIVGGGSVALGGTLNVIQDAGSYTGSEQYPIVEGAYTGEFKPTITGGLPGVQFQISYMPNIVYLLFGSSPISSEIPTNHLSGNALAIANYLNQNGSSSTLSLLTSLTESQSESALNRISPARNAFGLFIVQQTAFSLSTLNGEHLDAFRAGGKSSSENSLMAALIADASGCVPTSVKSKKNENNFSAWISGFGEYAHQKGALQNPSFNYLSGSVLGGFDYHENRNLVGGSLGYAHTHYIEDSHFGHGSINYYFASIYGNVHAGNFYFSPAIWGLFDKIDNIRDISFPGFSEKAKANIFVWQLIPHLEIGYDASFSWGDIIPFSSVDWAIIWQRGYQERGAAPFNAISEAESNSTVRSETGLKFCEKWEYDWGAFFLREKASYVFERPFGTGTVNTAFVGTPGAFTVTAVNQDLNLGAIGLDFLFVIGKQRPVKVDLAYEGEFGSQYWSNQLNFTVSKDF